MNSRPCNQPLILESLSGCTRARQRSSNQAHAVRARRMHGLRLSTDSIMAPGSRLASGFVLDELCYARNGALT